MFRINQIIVGKSRLKPKLTYEEALYWIWRIAELDIQINGKRTETVSSVNDDWLTKNLPATTGTRHQDNENGV